MSNDPFSLSNIRDIVEPAAISAWPQATTARLLGGLVIVWAVAVVVVLLIRRRRNAYRRAGLRELPEIEKRLSGSGTGVTALRELAVLLKRVALAAWPREHVASLSGERWLAFLDSTCPGANFTSGSGRLLESSSSASDGAMSSVARADIDGLVRAARRWIGHHRVPIADSLQRSAAAGSPRHSMSAGSPRRSTAGGSEPSARSEE
ncbi:MAG: DUF4381 domain-containing protein [Candidatus Eisenbacteria bacterium]|nr:DUF4381 domain-containing protein [Candidatus Eisenbacteria bacterium]